MYIARENKIYVIQNDKEELFLTVHPTNTGGTMTVEQQAIALADILNEESGI